MQLHVLFSNNIEMCIEMMVPVFFFSLNVYEFVRNGITGDNIRASLCTCVSHNLVLIEFS